jgi:hypothetical protein
LWDFLFPFYGRLSFFNGVCWKGRRSRYVDFGGDCLQSWEVSYYFMQKHSCFGLFVIIPLFISPYSTLKISSRKM